jgi:NitT/TauT family transport system permease protein/taurine transport system permease protein
MKLSPAQTRYLIIAIALVLWEALPRAGLIAPLFLPPLSETLAAGFGDARSYASHLLITLGEVAISMVFACGGGILVGAIVGSVPKLGRLLLPLFSSFYAVPLVVLYPVFTAWFGIGSESKIAFASIYGFFPTMLGTAAGIATIDPQFLLAARSMGATLQQRIIRVVVPAAIPTVLSSFRIGGALVIVGVVVSEMLISSAGIGYLITSYRTVLDSPHVFAAILLVLVLAVTFDGVVQFAERRTASWRLASRSAEAKSPRPAASRMGTLPATVAP